MSNKVKWFGQFDESFFNDPKMKKMKRDLGSSKYCYIYIRLLVLCAKSEGTILFCQTEDNIYEQLDLTIDESAKDIQKLLEFLEKNHLLFKVKDKYPLEKSDFTLPQVEQVTGSRTNNADYVQKYRQRQKSIKKAITVQVKEESLQCNAITLQNDNSVILCKDNKVKYNYLNDVSFIAKSEEIIKVLNETLNSENKPDDKEKKFGNKTKSTLSLIHSRLKDGKSVEDFKYVIKNQFNTWYDTDMQKYFRPSTLFGNKFEDYLNSPVFKRKQTLEQQVKDSQGKWTEC